MRSERTPRATRQEPRSRVTRLGRLVRGRRPDRNPLRRTSDRAETAVLAVLLIAFFAAAPFVVQTCGTVAHAIAHRVQLAQQASRHQVPAILVEAAPGSGTDAGYAAINPEAQARWTAPDRKVVTGEVPVPAGTAAGTAVQVWTTRDGQLTDPPLQDSQVAGQVDLAQISGVIGLATTLIVIGLLVRRALDRRRMAAWDADWLATGPRWTPRR